MPHAYTEDQLVEQPVIGLFAELGWTTVSASEETFGAAGTLGRETRGEVVLVGRLRAALAKLNPTLPPEAIAAAVDELTRDRSTMLLEQANREVYGLLKDGIKVSVPDRDNGGQKTERLRVVDWESPANNDFLLVSQLSVTGQLYTCRPDLVGFVNGLPLVVIELKKPGVPARTAFDDNLTHYKQQIPSLFWTNALLIASNGTDIYDLIEQAALEPEQEAKLERELSKQYHILTRDDRLETVAQDIVRHFLGRGFVGKAMVVSIDKATALKMHDKVRAHWAKEQARVTKAIAKIDAVKGNRSDEQLAQLSELNARLDVLTTTDMALIVSPGQNEIEHMKKLGLDITPHRVRMNDSQPPLAEKFKDTQDPLRLVFVCAMWLTGFDAPSCSTVYLDKPMRNHTLMQTIARANRVFPGKHSGVIVDYANVFASLEKALAIYGAGKGGANPVKDKQELVAELRRAVEAATVFCAGHGVALAAIEQLPVGNFDRLQLVSDAVNALIAPDTLRREFFAHERYVTTLYNAVKPDPAAVEFTGRASCLAAIAEAIRAKLNPNPADITHSMGEIAELLDVSITGAEIAEEGPPPLDLSRIDFEALSRRFKRSKTKNTDLEVLKAAIRAQLDKLIRINRTRADYLDKFEELIETYNNGSRSIEELFEELLKLSRSLSEEQKRHVRENLSEDELTIFDLLTRPDPALTDEERVEVKKVARLLHERLQEVLTLDWRRKASARASVLTAIKDTLDEGLPRAYTPEIYEKKCATLFEHVYEVGAA